MDVLQRFQQYAADFEKTYIDDDWSRLEPYFTEDAVYEVEGIADLGDRAQGHDAIFAQIRRALDQFDRRFSERRLELTAPPKVEGAQVEIFWAATYRRDGVPELRLLGTETAEYDGDRIRRLVDRYTPEMKETFDAWMAERGAQLGT